MSNPRYPFREQDVRKDVPESLVRYFGKERIDQLSATERAEFTTAHVVRMGRAPGRIVKNRNPVDPEGRS